MKKLLAMLVLCLGLTNCVEEHVVYADPPLPPTNPTYGCTIIEDSYGEREVCDTYYYVAPEGVIYWDTYYGVWIGAGGYWRADIWYHGFWPGYWARYGTWYHSHGWYGSHSFRGYYGHHWGGGGHNNFHGGGGHGGHGGHR